MIVVHVITTLVHGGAQRMLTRVVPDGGVDAHGVRHVVVVLRAGGVFAPSLEARGVPVHCLGVRPGPSLLLGWWRLVRLLRTLRPTLVLSWLYHADLLATLAVPFVGCRAGRRDVRLPLVWNLRGTPKPRGQGPWHTHASVWLLARLSRLPWAVAANSHAGRREHEAIGYHPRRWVLLPNGVDTDRWYPDAADREAVRCELGIRDDEVAVVSVARVHPQKDHATLLAAVRAAGQESALPGVGDPAVQDPALRLILIGPGTDTLALPEDLVASTVALGPRDDVERLLRGADVAVLSAAYGEGLPNVVAEAMATGLPTITTDVGDAALLVGDTGRVVPPRRPDRLAEELKALAAVGHVQRAELGHRARERVVGGWSLEVSQAAYARLVAAAANAHPSDAER